MNLTTRYLGLELANPLVHSASPLTQWVENVRRLEDAGTAAVVMYSLFEEEITHESRLLDHYTTYGTESHAEAQNYAPDFDAYHIGPDEYLKRVARTREAVDIPVIASLNGVSKSGWIDYARQIEEAGAHALELNVYYLPTDPSVTGAQVEQNTVDIVEEVVRRVSIPVAVKLGPFYSSIPNMAKRIVRAGARALVLFNRFYQPTIDLESLEVKPDLVLSTREEIRLPLRWIAILHGRVEADLALTTGVHDWDDVIRGVMAGASVTMMTSEILARGIGRVEEILRGVERWMEENEYESIARMTGSLSHRNAPDPAVFERANYLKTLHSWSSDPTGRLHF